MSTNLPFSRALMAMIGISLVILLIAIDQTVVDTSLPTIIADLKGFTMYSWVATSFMLMSVVSVPIFGHLGDYFGRKPFVLSAVFLFTGASILCGMAENMLFLVLARGLQGIGGGMLLGTGFACIPDLFSETTQRLRWGLFITAAFGLGNGIGPTLGGLMLEHYSWRLVFYINLPIGIISFLVVWRFLPYVRHSDGQNNKVRLDWVGAFLIVVVFFCLQLSVQELPIYGLSGVTIAAMAPCVLGFYGLLKWEQKVLQPIMPLAMLRNPDLSGLFSQAVFLGFTMFSLLFYVPLMFQGGLGMSPRESGLMVTPLVICIALAGVVNSYLVPIMSKPTKILSIGFLVLAAGCLGMVFLGRTTPYSHIYICMILSGWGLGFVLPNLSVFAQEKIECRHVGIVTALLQSLRIIGGMVGIGVIGTLIDDLYVRGVHRMLEERHAETWFLQFNRLKSLIDHEEQTELIARLASAGHDGILLIEAAREILIRSVHAGMMLIVVVALIGALQARRLPDIQIEVQKKKAKPRGRI